MEADPPPDIVPPETHVFAVVSWGCAATAWLAKTLNSHADIDCVHAANQSWAAEGGAPYLTGERYLRTLGSQGLAYAAAGDVHGVPRHEIPALRHCFGSYFGCAVVVRHPLPRLASQFALFYAHPGSRAWGDLLYVDPLIEAAGLDPARIPYEERLLFHGANMLNAILQEREVARIFRTEDLTTEAAALHALVTEITGGKVAPDEGWAARALAAPSINRHRGGEEVAFNPIEMRAIRAAVRPESWEAYRELGYALPGWVTG